MESAEAIVDGALEHWGPQLRPVPSDVRQAYVRALRNAEHAHAICEEYRAAATIDRSHDQADLATGRRIACPLQVLWSRHGPLDTWYDAGPLSIWQAWADDVRGEAVEGGHFFPEQSHERTSALLRAFLGSGCAEGAE